MVKMSANNRPNCSQERCMDDSDVEWIRTEFLNNNDSNRKQTWKDKRQSRKRKAESLPRDNANANPMLNTKIRIHQCDAASLFQITCVRQLVKTLKKEAKIASKNLSFEGPKISPYELQMNDVYDQIIESIKRNHIFKSTLSSDVLRSNPETIDGPCIVKSYQWENDLHNSFVSKLNCGIKETAVSILNQPWDCKNKLNAVISELNKAVIVDGFSNRWNWYGSYLYGLVFVDSTMHLHYECVPDDVKTASKISQDVFQTICTCLQGRKEFVDLKYNSFVPFPWISFYNVTSDESVQITVSNDLNSGELRVRNSLLMKLYLDMCTDLKYLIGFVKLVMKKYSVHGTHGAGKLESYTLFWLVAFFMQQKKLLPAVIDVRKAAKMKYTIAGWDCSLPDPDQYSYQTEPVALYSLLLGFFDYYKDFDFLRYVVCPYVGRAILLSDFERLQIPISEFSVYFKQLRDSRRLSFRKNVMNLQDPSDLACNVAERLQPECANQFKAVCHRLSDMLPSSMEEIRKINCFCELFPYKMEYYNYLPHDLAQYCTVILNTSSDLGFDERREKKLNQIYILEAIRKIMELVFKLKKKSIIITQNVVQVVFDGKNETLVTQTYPVIYFEYYSTEKTWENDNTYMREIIPQGEVEKEPVRIILTSEICLEKHFIRLIIQSNANFSKFLRLYLHRMLRFTLSEIVPV